MRVLVAFASKHGATSEIAEAIAAALKERGVEADVKSIDAVTDPEAFDAVILGSAVYMGHWLDSAQAFAKSHQEQLTDRPTWLFSSGPVGDPPRPSESEAVDIGDIQAAVKPRGHLLLPGALDKSRLGCAERAVT